jgi:hypothetical protein
LRSEIFKGVCPKETMEDAFDERPIFTVVVEDLQEEAERLFGRRLNEEDIIKAKKGVESCLSLCSSEAIRFAIEEVVEN